jgi:hypothetical protein
MADEIVELEDFALELAQMAGGIISISIQPMQLLFYRN